MTNLYEVTYLYETEEPFVRVMDAHELKFLQEQAENLYGVEILKVKEETFEKF